MGKNHLEKEVDPKEFDIQSDSKTTKSALPILILIIIASFVLTIACGIMSLMESFDLRPTYFMVVLTVLEFIVFLVFEFKKTNSVSTKYARQQKKVIFVFGAVILAIFVVTTAIIVSNSNNKDSSETSSNGIETQLDQENQQTITDQEEEDTRDTIIITLDEYNRLKEYETFEKEIGKTVKEITVDKEYYAMVKRWFSFDKEIICPVCLGTTEKCEHEHDKEVTPAVVSKLTTTPEPTKKPEPTKEPTKKPEPTKEPTKKPEVKKDEVGPKVTVSINEKSLEVGDEAVITIKAKDDSKLKGVTDRDLEVFLKKYVDGFGNFAFMSSSEDFSKENQYVAKVTVRAVKEADFNLQIKAGAFSDVHNNKSKKSASIYVSIWKEQVIDYELDNVDVIIIKPVPTPTPIINRPSNPDHNNPTPTPSNPTPTPSNPTPTPTEPTPTPSNPTPTPTEPTPTPSNPTPTPTNPEPTPDLSQINLTVSKVGTDQWYVGEQGEMKVRISSKFDLKNVNLTSSSFSEAAGIQILSPGSIDKKSSTEWYITVPVKFIAAAAGDLHVIKNVAEDVKGGLSGTSDSLSYEIITKETDGNHEPSDDDVQLDPSEDPNKRPQAFLSGAQTATKGDIVTVTGGISDDNPSTVTVKSSNVLSVQGAELTEFNWDGLNFTASIKCTSVGNATVTVNSDVALDANGLGNFESTGITIEVVPPTEETTDANIIVEQPQDQTEDTNGNTIEEPDTQTPKDSEVVDDDLSDSVIEEQPTQVVDENQDQSNTDTSQQPTDETTEQPTEQHNPSEDDIIW